MIAQFHQRTIKRWRFQKLVAQMEGWLAQGATVLDLGAGDGALAAELFAKRPDLKIRCLETHLREIPYFPVEKYEGPTLPFADGAFDCVLLMDVLHHCHIPLQTFFEAARVAKRAVIVKDHSLTGLFAGLTLRLMDGVGNGRFGVEIPCHYWTPANWREAAAHLGLKRIEFRDRLGLYPVPLRLFFERSLHFLAKWDTTGLNRALPEQGFEKLSWEMAYHSFENPREEKKKFSKRFAWSGLSAADRNARVLEVFCGSATGLELLEEWGFKNLTGVDNSATVGPQKIGAIRRLVADGRELPLASQSQDWVVVQGGLHHLPGVGEDLDRALAEISRVLAPGGRVLIVEPWLTPFLRFVHWVCRSSVLRQLHPKVKALAEMIDLEERTYFGWLNAGPQVGHKLESFFAPLKKRVGFGKIAFVGQPKTGNQTAAPLNRKLG